MSQPKVLVTRRIPQAGLARVKEVCEVRHWDSDEAIPRQTLLEWIAGMDGLYCLLTERVDNELLTAAGPSLRIVSTMSVGYDHINVASCRAHNVLIGNTPGVLTDTTADLTLTLLLATARRVIEAAAAVKSGEWGTWKPEWMLGRDLYGSTVGIVGLGRIGVAVAQRLRGFGCRILYTGNQPKAAAAEAVGAEFVEMATLLAESDFVTAHCPYNPSTHHLFNAQFFQQMKPTAIFVNTTRGGTVDQDALYDALKNGEIAAAGLDVTTPEPLSPTHPLLTLPNCVVLPHIGSASVATRTKMALMTAENLIAGVLGEQVPNLV